MVMTNFETIRARAQGNVGFIQFNRPAAGNTINQLMVEECRAALAELELQASVIVLEGTPEVFCLGADFAGMQREGGTEAHDPEPLYDLWTRLSAGSFVSVAHVRGKANAGGVGFVAACDVVLAATSAEFSLSELLFGLLPACVMPFLVRRVGLQRAQYMTLMTRPFAASQAAEWGLVDAHDEQSEVLLRKHLLRLRRLPKKGIVRYKRYAAQLQPLVSAARPLALALNREVFSDAENLRAIRDFVESGRLPWEGDERA